MYKISFIGNQNIEFASKWRERLVPDQVQTGRNISKKIATEKINIRDINISNLQDRASNSRRTNKVVKYDTDPLTTRPEIMRREDRANGKKGISNPGRAKLNQLKDSAKKRKSILGKAVKFIGKNKLGIGLAGAAALGGIGYGIARKMRSDKGKKRGFYK